MGEYLIPLAKVELKVTIDKGFNGQSCFDSPDMGDVERPRAVLVGGEWFGCFDSPDMGDVESCTQKRLSFPSNCCFDSPDMGDVESEQKQQERKERYLVASTLLIWEILKGSNLRNLRKKLKGAED